MATTSSLKQKRGAALVVCLDVNIWVQYLMATTHGRETAVTTLVGMIDGTAPGPIPTQLSLSHELLDTLERVLLRAGIGRDQVAAFITAIRYLEQTGPLRPGTMLLVAGRDQLAMRDREDAGVLAACIAGRVHLLITDNLKDFETNDFERVDTKSVRRHDGSMRQLYALIHQRADGVSLVVMHPHDVVDWLRAGDWPVVEAVKQRYV